MTRWEVAGVESASHAVPPHTSHPDIPVSPGEADCDGCLLCYMTPGQAASRPYHRLPGGRRLERWILDELLPSSPRAEPREAAL